VKVFLEEEGSSVLDGLLARPGPVVTSRIGYVEGHAAFARARREGRLSSGSLAAVRRAFDERWASLAVVEVDSLLAEHAGRVAYRYGLRAGDAIHLASALSVTEHAGEATFASWDVRLWGSAHDAGFRMEPSKRPT
jgi:uncharacterized protein